MDPTMFTVTNEQLAALDPTRATEFAAELLWSEARRIGLPTTHVHISTRINVADGGVDAAITPPDVGPKTSTFLPSGRSAFQIKAGESFAPWQPAEIRVELFGKKEASRDNLGISVRSCMEEDGTYVLFCTSVELVESQRLEAKKLLCESFAACGYSNSKVEVWDRKTLLGLLKVFPALALQLNGRGHIHFATHRIWSSQSEMRRSFKAGPGQQRFIDALQATLRPSEGPIHIRIRGEAGIGKTRLVLQATAAEDIRPLVIYCDGPGHLLDGQLISELVREGIELSAILVVDECDLERRALIWNQLQYHSPRIKLISIYNDLEEPAGTTVLQDAPLLEDAQVIQIIEEYGTPPHESSRWAGFCDGSPRVAHVIGLNLKSNPDDVLRPPDTVNIWDRYVAGGDNSGSEAVQERRIVLRHIALFKRFGYGAPVIDEAKAIANFAMKASPSITWPRFQEIVKLLRERKILQGETTLYITPRLLHIKLWTDWWDTYGEGFDPLQFTKELPPKLGEWFLEMFQYAAQSGAALKITQELLDEKGRFGKISFFENRRGATFFLALTNAAPEAALRYLLRTVGAWDVGALSKFAQGRREVVWSLERIAVWRMLFPDAARLLLKLAEAENEDFANNSTGVFADLFSPGRGSLAPTEASPEERFPILKEALDSPTKKTREIALKACDQALQTSGMSRMIGVEYQGLRRPPQLWVPKTWGEVFEAYRRVWNLLLEKLNAFEPDECEKAIEILTSHARGLSGIPNVSDMVIGTLSNLAAKFPSSRRKIIEAVEHIVHYESNSLTPDKFQQWEALRTELTGTDFHSQMERYVGMDLLEDGFDEKGNIIDKVAPQIVSLARQIIDAPTLLWPELPWLVTEAAKNGYRFGRELATLDPNFSLNEKLLEAQRNPTRKGSVFFLSGYFSGMFERDPAKWETILDVFQGDEILRGYVPELTWRSGMTERAAVRILSMAKGGIIFPEHMRMFSFGGVIRKVPERVFVEWIQYLLQSGTRTAAWIALDLFFFYYVMGETHLTLPRDLALRVLTAEPFFARAASTVQMEDYEWTQLAKAFIRDYPSDGIEIARPLLRTFGEEGTISSPFRSETAKVLKIVTKQMPDEIWRIVATYLGPPIDSRAYHLTQWLREGALSLIPPETVMAWIENDAAQRAWYLASFVPPTLTPPQQVQFCWAREVLVRYGGREDVRRNLHANFSTEGWSGPMSAHYLNKKQWLQGLRKTETDPNVIKWIDEYGDSVQRTIDGARVEEERDW